MKNLIVLTLFYVLCCYLTCECFQFFFPRCAEMLNRIKFSAVDGLKCHNCTNESPNCSDPFEANEFLIECPPVPEHVQHLVSNEDAICCRKLKQLSENDGCTALKLCQLNNWSIIYFFQLMANIKSHLAGVVTFKIMKPRMTAGKPASRLLSRLSPVPFTAIAQATAAIGLEDKSMCLPF